MGDDLCVDGFALHHDRLSDTALAPLGALFQRLSVDQAGARIDSTAIEELPFKDFLWHVAACRLGSDAKIVRAILFDKNDGANWALGWHQDRTIEVARHAEVPGYGPFTRKQGRLHVAPPIALTERMLTMRIHFDAVDARNGPLIVAPKSHRMGYVPEADIAAIVAACGQSACLAESGAIWLYSTPILHRSERSTAGRRRRVLQLDFSADELPGGLQWAVAAQRALEAEADLT